MFGNINSSSFLNNNASANTSNTSNTLNDYCEPGISIYLLQDLFKIITSQEFSSKDFSIKLSYLEIYNEHIRDLLISNSENLMILEDPVKGVVVPDLSEYSISAVQDLIDYIQKGNHRRTMASTAQNQFSSRSHAIIQLTLEQKSKAKDINEEIVSSKLSLVDLAGSERAASSENKGIRLTEGAKINRSLLALGNCINILSDPHKSGSFVPYRDSKLTRLLKDSLGGNTKTIMIACITPSGLFYEESVNTLKYASRARFIQRKVTKNIREVETHVSQYKEIIESLKNEIMELKNQLKFKGLSEDCEKRTRNPETFAENQDFDEKFEDLGKKIYANLEENWEIKQSLHELKDLKLENENSLKNCLTALSQVIEDADSAAFREKLTQEIASIQKIMENNEKVQREMEQALEKNHADKRKLQENMRKLNKILVSKEQVPKNQDFENLLLSLKMLRLEKLDLYSENLELRSTISRINEEKAAKDCKIEELEALVSRLEAENSKENRKNAKELQENQKDLQRNCGPSQIYFKIPEKFLNNNCNNSNIAAKDRKNDVKIVRNHNKTRKTPENPEENCNNIEKIEKNDRKAPVNVEELKNYAEKIKNLNFDNVKLKKRKKRYHNANKNQEKPEKPEKTEKIEKIPDNTENILAEKLEKIAENIKNTEELSSILRDPETSCENLEEFLKSLEISKPLEPRKGPTTQRDDFSSKNSRFSNNCENFSNNFANLNNNLANCSNNYLREASLEKASRLNIQNLDVAREKLRNFKAQLNNLLKNLGNGENNSRFLQEIRGLLEDFSANKYVISQHDREMLEKLGEMLEKTPNFCEKSKVSQGFFSKVSRNYAKITENSHKVNRSKEKYAEIQ